LCTNVKQMCRLQNHQIVLAEEDAFVASGLEWRQCFGHQLAPQTGLQTRHLAKGLQAHDANDHAVHLLCLDQAGRICCPVLPHHVPLPSRPQGLTKIRISLHRLLSTPQIHFATDSREVGWEH